MIGGPDERFELVLDIFTGGLAQHGGARWPPGAAPMLPSSGGIYLVPAASYPVRGTSLSADFRRRAGAEFPAEGSSLTCEGLGTVRRGTAMTQIRITKRRRPDDWRLEPLPLDPRDPDIVRAKEIARRASAGTPSSGTAGRSSRPGR